MTKKQLKALISAGLFSAALMSGRAYADDSAASPASPATATDEKSMQTAPSSDASPAPTPKLHDDSNAKNSKQTTSTKSGADHGCGGANGCGGKGQ